MSDCLADVCADMSRFHGVRDVSRMRSADFFAAAARLPYYDGAVSAAMRRMAAAQQSRGVPLTAQRMQGAEFAGSQGLAPVFQIG